MFSLTVLTVSLVLGLAHGQLLPECPPVHIIVARASLEQPGTGIIGSVAQQIASDNEGTTIEAVDYPATLQDYGNSSAQGTEAMTVALNNVAIECPDTKVVLMGYSQGAHVVGDTMCGGGAIGQNGSLPNRPAVKAAASKVVAMVQMGDPRFLANQSYDVGSSINNGIFPRPANVSCKKYAPIIKSYCNTGDPFCARGSNLTVHLQYVSEFGQNAKKFVDSRIKAGFLYVYSSPSIYRNSC